MQTENKKITEEIKTQTQTTALNRVDAYDWLRIIATIWVIIGHSVILHESLAHGNDLTVLVPNISPVYNSGFLTFCRFLSGWVYIFHMPLFFALSGAVFALKKLPRMDDIVRSKARRLMIPYFACGLFYMLPVKLLIGFYSPSQMPEVIRTFLTCDRDTCAHLWFLPALFWSMMLAAALIKLFERLKINSLYLLLFAGWVIHLCFNLIPVNFFFLKEGMDYCVFFIFGYVFEHERRRLKPVKTGALLAAFILLLFMEALYKEYMILDNFSGLVCGCILSYVAAVLLGRFFGTFTKTRVWNMIIRNLFAVYLLHDPLEYATAVFFVRTGLLRYGAGCLAYTFMRMLGTGIISIILAEAGRSASGQIGKMLRPNP